MNLETVISIGISIFALAVSIVAVLYIREKIKLTKKDMYLRSISPEPYINIWNGEVNGITISADIANVYGYANEPKWTWCLNFKNRTPIYGKLTDDGISEKQPGGMRRKMSYIPPESITCHLEAEVPELKRLDDLEGLYSLEIWVNYGGKNNTTYNSYKIFKYRDKKWTDENKRTKVWRE